MARPNKKESEVKNIPIVTMCSKEDIERHDGKVNLTEKFRAVRDCKGTCESCDCLPNTNA